MKSFRKEIWLHLPSRRGLSVSSSGGSTGRIRSRHLSGPEREALWAL